MKRRQAGGNIRLFTCCISLKRPQGCLLGDGFGRLHASVQRRRKAGRGNGCLFTRAAGATGGIGGSDQLNEWRIELERSSGEEIGGIPSPTGGGFSDVFSGGVKGKMIAVPVSCRIEGGIPIWRKKTAVFRFSRLFWGARKNLSGSGLPIRLGGSCLKFSVKFVQI